MRRITYLWAGLLCWAAALGLLALLLGGCEMPKYNYLERLDNSIGPSSSDDWVGKEVYLGDGRILRLTWRYGDPKLYMYVFDNEGNEDNPYGLVTQTDYNYMGNYSSVYSMDMIWDPTTERALAFYSVYGAKRFYLVIQINPDNTFTFNEVQQASSGYNLDKMAINPATGEIVRIYSAAYDVGTISGQTVTINPGTNTITLGPGHNLQAAERISATPFIIFNEASGKYLFVYQDRVTNAYRTAYMVHFKVLTVTGTSLSLGPEHTLSGGAVDLSTDHFQFTYGGYVYPLLHDDKILVMGNRLRSSGTGPSDYTYLYGYLCVIDISSGSIVHGPVTAPPQLVTDSYAGSRVDFAWIPLINKYMMITQLSNSFNEDRWVRYFTIENNQVVFDEEATLIASWGDAAPSNIHWAPEYDKAIVHRGVGYTQKWDVFGPREDIFWTNWKGQTERLSE